MISIRGPSIRRKLRGVPQVAQKSRSAIEEDLNAAGLPRVQAKSLLSMSAKEANGAPEAVHVAEPIDAKTDSES